MGHKTWKDNANPGWELDLLEDTGEWTITDGASVKVIPSKWVLATRHQPCVVWLGTQPIYVWTSGHDAHASTLAGGLCFRGVFGGPREHESAPAVLRCECGAASVYGVGCSGSLHSRWCPMFELLRKEG